MPQFAEQGRILLVDDEIEHWKECLGRLARFGYRVDTADDGQGAWEALQTNDYDVLITDNKMPRLSGLDLITKLRGQGVELPIIFVSSAMPVITAQQKGCLVDVHFLKKPVAPAKLLATIEHLALWRHCSEPSLNSIGG